MCGAGLRAALNAGLSSQAVVASASIPAPLVLPAQSAAASTLVECSVTLSTGRLEISSAGSGGAKSVHVSAAAARMEPRTSSLPAGAAPSSRHAQAALGLAVPAESDGTRVALGNLQADTHRSGLWMDPAPFDCFLQLGQVFHTGK